MLTAYLQLTETETKKSHRSVSNETKLKSQSTYHSFHINPPTKITEILATL